MLLSVCVCVCVCVCVRVCVCVSVCVSLCGGILYVKTSKCLYCFGDCQYIIVDRLLLYIGIFYVFCLCSVKNWIVASSVLRSHLESTTICIWCNSITSDVVPVFANVTLNSFEML